MPSINFQFPLAKHAYTLLASLPPCHSCPFLQPHRPLQTCSLTHPQPRVSAGPFNLSISSWSSFPKPDWLPLWLSTVWPGGNNLANQGPPTNLKLSKQASGLYPSVYPAPSTDLTLVLRTAATGLAERT